MTDTRLGLGGTELAIVNVNDYGHVNNLHSHNRDILQQTATDETHTSTGDGNVANESDGKENEPVIDIVINNVVCSFATRCHLNLKKIALEAQHVIYRRENGMVSMKIRKPYTTASIWSSGKITCTGATSEDDSKIAARKFSRILQNLGFRIRFSNFRVVNVLGTCSMPFGIRITHFSRDHKESACYEPELHPGVTYRIKSPKATLKIFSTGSITVTAPSVLNVQLAIEHIFPLVANYKMEPAQVPKKEIETVAMHLVQPFKRKTETKTVQYMAKRSRGNNSSDESCTSDEDDFDSDESQD